MESSVDDDDIEFLDPIDDDIWKGDEIMENEELEIQDTFNEIDVREELVEGGDTDVQDTEDITE